MPSPYALATHALCCCLLLQHATTTTEVSGGSESFGGNVLKTNGLGPEGMISHHLEWVARINTDMNQLHTLFDYNTAFSQGEIRTDRSTSPSELLDPSAAFFFSALMALATSCRRTSSPWQTA